MASASGLSVNNFVSTAGLPAGSQTSKAPVVESLGNAARTLTWADSGKLFTLDAITAARTYTLPPMATSAGMNFRVSVRVAPGGNVATFQAPAAGDMVAIFTGLSTDANPSVQSLNVPQNANTRSVVTNGDTAIGAFLELYCDGLKWRAFATGANVRNVAVQWALA